jgi:hypothetical protein
MEKVRPEDTERMIQLLDRDGDRQVRPAAARTPQLPNRRRCAPITQLWAQKQAHALAAGQWLLGHMWLREMCLRWMHCRSTMRSFGASWSCCQRTSCRRAALCPAGSTARTGCQASSTGEHRFAPKLSQRIMRQAHAITASCLLGWNCDN